jgi:hypothetical protein
MSMTRKNRRRIARWLLRSKEGRMVIRADFVWLWDGNTFYFLQCRMHNEHRIYLPPPEPEDV